MTIQAERSFKRKRKDEPKKKSKVKLESMQRLPYEEALKAHKWAIERGARCTECPLFGLKCGPVESTIVRDARVTVIGEAPGESELEQRENFVGKSGEVLNNALLEGGVAREECSILNTCLCRPPEEFRAFEYRLKLQYKLAMERWKEKCTTAKALGESEPPEPKPPLYPSQACFPRLKRDIEESGAPVVLAVGSPALQAVAAHWEVPYGSAKKAIPGQIRISSLKRQMGAPTVLPDGTICVATYHPAFAMRPGSRHYMHIVKRFITRAADISRRGIDWEEPEYILNPTSHQIEDILGRMKRARAIVSVDIETDKGVHPSGKFDPHTCRIRCIGFGAVLEGKEVIICVPIRRINGLEWWPDREEKRRVLQACLDVLNTCMLVGHNLAFDTLVMARLGLITERERIWHDTMLMHHDTRDNDAPHDLGFVGAQYFELPAWKGMADDKQYENVTDADLHLYNARDVLVVLRLLDVLYEEVVNCGNTSQYELDQQLAPIFRDMGDLGLFIDEHKRGELSRKMNLESYHRLVRLRKITNNRAFNPNSTRHIQNYLFRTKKLTPEVNTKGKDWEEGEDPSTNTQSLLRLLTKQACDKDTNDFVNTLLEYRAYTKLRGTYIDNLMVHYEDWTKYGINEGWNGKAKAVPATVWHPYKTKAEVKKAKDENRDIEGEWRQTFAIPERGKLSRLHATYKIHVIPSGRASATPAIQCFPERGKANLRQIVIAPPGHVLVGADFDQIELRLYAAIAGDKLLLQAFKDGLDAHAWNAASLFAKRFGMTIQQTYDHINALPKQEKKKLRNIAKTFVYLETYGGEADKLYVYMSQARDKATGELLFPGLTEADVNEWHDQWHKTHPETKRWQEICARSARLEGYTSSPIGSYRKRFFMGGANKPGATFNHVIQSTAAEIANAAAIRIAKRIPYKSWSPFTGLVLQVHDYLGAYVPFERAKEAKKIIEECMNCVIFGIPITATAKVSKRWSKQ